MKKLLKLFFVGSLLVLPLLMMSFQKSQKSSQMQDWNNKNYEQQWKEIEELEKQGLPKSALEKVELLYQKAQKEDNAPQVVKSLIYRIKYTSQLEEDGMVKAIDNTRQEIDKADFPEKPLLQSMLGQLYQAYLDNNYWSFRNRTNTPGFQSEDIRTWSVEQLIQASNEQYLASVRHDQLKEVPIGSLEAILQESRNSEGLRPTLYDLIIHRAIDHFSNERSYLTEPAFKFNITREEAFAPAAQFVQATFQTRDSSSGKWVNLQLLQDLLKNHLKDADPAVLIDADLKRLRFVYNNALQLPKDSLYIGALDALSGKYEKHPSASEILYEKALTIYQKGHLYSDQDSEKLQWVYRDAYDLCQQIIKQYPDAFGAKQAALLATSIQQKNLNLNVEEVNLPNEPFLAQISYQNVHKAYLKVVRIAEKDRETFEYKNTKEKIEWLNQQRAVRSWSQKLPEVGDYRMHSVEIKMDALPIGEYAVLIADNDRFGVENGAVGHLTTTVSGIGYLYRMNEEGKAEFVVVDRKSGTPLEGIKAEFYSSEYNRRLRRSERKRIGQAFSDNLGFVKVLLDRNNYFQVKFSKGEDVLFFSEGYSNYRSTRKPESKPFASFFLDRAIYRPGQMLYFKALVLKADSQDKPEIIAGKKIEISLLDVNNQEVDKIELVTNEFGTVNGSFQIPRSGLTGRMQLQADIEGRKAFQVEEYKRPRFEVNFNPLDGTYNLGDTVRVEGKAMAFAGNAIDGASVQYRVVRQVRFPWFYRGGYFPGSFSNMEIANGVLKTDEKGQFQIDFKAIPDEEVSEDRKPLFIYTVYADVTDVSGETRSGFKSVRIGSYSLLLDAKLGQVVDRSQKSIELSSSNLDGNEQATEIEVEIYQLNAPGQYFLDRYWAKPDQYVLEEKAFKEAFPLLAYKEENEKTNWPVADRKFKATINTGTSKLLEVGMQYWPVGEYKMLMKAEDEAGRPVEQIRYFSLMDENARQLPSTIPFWAKLSQQTYQPDETAMLNLGTSQGQLLILSEMEKKGKLTSSSWEVVQPWSRLGEPITEADRGNFHWHITYVKHNRYFVEHYQINVPWTNKQLQIELSSFRDKVLPGAEEEWQIRISGPEKEAVVAEMAATMYDASLDAFVPHNWYMNFYPVVGYPRYTWSPQHFRYTNAYVIHDNDWQPYIDNVYRSYPDLNWFGYGFYGGLPQVYARSFSVEEDAQIAISAPAEGKGIAEKSSAFADSSFLGEEDAPPPPPPPPGEPAAQVGLSDIPVRTNLDETVFFLPQLRTDEQGNLVINFTMNEALTRWKFLGLAHTNDLKIGSIEQEIVTQKDLMVQPNAPRFIREGDEIVYAAKVSNLTDSTLSGQATLLLFDATTNQPVDQLFSNTENTVSFEAAAGQSAPLSWTLKVPQGKVPVLSHRVIAKAGTFSDGEESAIPVLTNKMLVTETMPLPVNGKQTKTFTFERMKELGNSNTLQNHQFALEFTSNPAWYAVQALPYLMEYPYDCTEQIFNRFYANSLAASVANSHPDIKAVFESWKDAEALESNLTKNEELKSLLIKETPWVFAAQSEAQQKKNIGLLFDLTRMAEEQALSIRQLKERQSADGGFSWFPGGRDSWYITQYMVEGMGHLDYLGVEGLQQSPDVQDIINGAVRFIDEEILEEYLELEERVKEDKAKWSDDHLNHLVIHYLYARSFYPNIALPESNQNVLAYYQEQAEKYWLKKGLYEQGLIALALHRAKRPDAPGKIIKSLKERALQDEELGMYWKYDRGYFWYQLPIETHALLTELFAEVTKDEASVQALKQWLLKHKQTNNWKTTKATAAAVYALLSYGDNWILEDQPVEISFEKGNKKDNRKISEAQEAAEKGTGYFKVSWDGTNVSNDLSRIKVKNPNKGIAWGGIYWQYFEQLDKITTFEETPLQLKKQLFKEVASDRGPQLESLTTGASLKPGDKVMVRIELRVDRPMEYVHMKDMRASGLEPINVLSQYKWQGGLGYYESTGDAATNFFFSYLPRGTYVFEYPLRVFHEGDFSNGVTTIQCMYAPEFTSHSEGERIKIK